MNAQIINHRLSAEDRARANDAALTIEEHSRSFSLATRFLPPHVRDDVKALYAWCREVDNAVDEAASKSEASKALSMLKEDISRIATGEATLHPASEWLKPLILQRGVNPEHALELIAGMELDLNGFQVGTASDLRRYCYHAAGTVGLMMVRLLGASDPRADAHAVALGTAMQMTNIARDVREDAELGRSYLPGIQRPLTCEQTEIATAVKQVLHSAESEYRIAIDGLKYLPRDCRRAIHLALVYYREIGRQIKRNNFSVMAGRTIVSKFRLAGLTLDILIADIIAVRFFSIPQALKAITMNDPNPTPSTISQAKQVVYLGLSLTSIMAAALFIMVYMNPKDGSYGMLPIVYAVASVVFAFVTNQLSVRVEQASSE
ncbi:phytoene/squalene synthase family protein [Planctomycetaceae bacterium SH139]